MSKSKKRTIRRTDVATKTQDRIGYEVDGYSMEVCIFFNLENKLCVQVYVRDSFTQLVTSEYINVDKMLDNIKSLTEYRVEGTDDR